MDHLVPRWDVKRWRDFLASLPLAGTRQREGGRFSCINKQIISHPVIHIIINTSSFGHLFQPKLSSRIQPFSFSFLQEALLYVGNIHEKSFTGPRCNQQFQSSDFDSAPKLSTLPWSSGVSLSQRWYSMP